MFDDTKQGDCPFFVNFCLHSHKLSCIIMKFCECKKLTEFILQRACYQPFSVNFASFGLKIYAQI